MKMDERQWSFVSALSMAKPWLRDLVKETVQARAGKTSNRRLSLKRN
jgi:hypothetical protein